MFTIGPRIFYISHNLVDEYGKISILRIHWNIFKIIYIYITQNKLKLTTTSEGIINPCPYPRILGDTLFHKAITNHFRWGRHRHTLPDIYMMPQTWHLNHTSSTRFKCIIHDDFFMHSDTFICLHIQICIHTFKYLYIILNKRICIYIVLNKRICIFSFPTLRFHTQFIPFLVKDKH